MRLPLFAFATLVALAASGCDSNGIDTPGGGTPGGGGGTTPPLTFAPIDPSATYLRTDAATDDATPLLLADYGLAPGDIACFRTVGDFFYVPSLLASSRTDTPLATGVFSASSILNATSERERVKDAIDGNWDIVTRPVYPTDSLTNIDEDFEVTDNCWPVPAGATHLFLSAYDDSFQDNSDATAGGQAFGVVVSER